ncbi:MFS transporter [Burkholderia gladioli]|jgi:MFS family permease|uniref:MFS transporter n=1 Tax=Burkholderia gladioli TaxID=28095 RepID=UPI0016415E1E|nr:MFS transporter [Burkholderia gladioli]
MTQHSLPLSSAQPATATRRGLLVATTIGNALEFFDFTVFGFLAIAIGHNFFSPLSTRGQLLLSATTFGVGFLVRPLGGVLIGLYADRAGRRAAMTLTLSLMALGACLAGLAPTYAQIGVAAPCVMIVARLIQGFSAGGEVGPSTVVLLEHAPPAARAWYTSWQLASQGIGIALGAASAALLSAWLPQAALLDWGWRVPFLLGAAILPVGVLIRRRLGALEQEARADGATPAAARRTPPGELLREHGANFAGGVLLLMGGTVTAYMILFFIPTYAIHALKLGESASYGCAVASGLLLALLSPLAGAIADRVGRRLPIVIGRLALIAALYPAYAWLSEAPSITRLLIVIVVLIVPYTLQGAPSVTLVTELFPKPIRVTATGSVYSVAVAIFGGLTPPLALWLVDFTGSRFAPAGAATLAMLVSSISLLFLRPHLAHVARGSARPDAPPSSH